MEMLVPVQVRRFARLEKLGRDADAALSPLEQSFELTCKPGKGARRREWQQKKRCLIRAGG